MLFRCLGRSKDLLSDRMPTKDQKPAPLHLGDVAQGSGFLVYCPSEINTAVFYSSPTSFYSASTFLYHLAFVCSPSFLYQSVTCDFFLGWNPILLNFQSPCSFKQRLERRRGGGTRSSYSTSLSALSMYVFKTEICNEKIIAYNHHFQTTKNPVSVIYL
jgi:hypothetical protein